ncbi:MAG: U32 family peptidase [Clostridiales bacterium]|nr:U32 family peptidase [Clostridiales bacterium]
MQKQAEAEILAPAGTREALIAAVRCGANAVYLGGKLLNARRNAGNFDDEALKEAVRYCHERGVQVYLTLNTLVRDAELKDAEHMLALSCEAGIDALITQDLGIARLARNCAPDIPLHASTQMSVQTLAGLEELKSLGFTRAVLPRELTLGEITALAAHSPVELELFIHGALCMCVSGQCYLSAMLGSRSGSRGLCAQPCRLPFVAPGGTGADLSLKDLSLIPHIRTLHEAGVLSFKIEGRMKRPEYVAAAVTACRQALENGEPEGVLSRQLQAVFSRSGFTDGYYTGQRGRAMFGTRGKEDVSAAAPVLKELSRLYEKERPLTGVAFSFTMRPGIPLTLTGEVRGQSVCVQSKKLPEPALTRPLTEAEVTRQLSKCGGTPYYAQSVHCDLAPGLTAPLSCLNALRREALEALTGLLGKPARKQFQAGSTQAPAHKTKAPAVFYARFTDETQLPPDLSAFACIYLPLHTPAPRLRALVEAGAPIAVEIPRGLFGREAAVRAELKAAKQAGITTALAHTLGAVRMAQEAGLLIHGGFGLNLFNTQALEQASSMGLEKATLSFELTLAQAAALGGELPRGLIAYGSVPLMLTRNCPIANGKPCRSCGKDGVLTDRKGICFPVACTDGCSELLNSRPIYLADRLAEVRGIDFLLLYFTRETPEQCAGILTQYQNGAAPDGAYTRGLYFRGVE